MKIKIAIALLSSLALAPLPVHASGKIIQPGRSIGAVILGESRSAVQKSLGKPNKTSSRKGGIVEARWNSHFKTPAGLRNYISVMFKRGKVAQIKVTSPAFTTPQGYSTATALSVWKQTYGRMRNVWYSYDGPPVSYRATYYDSIREGIAFVQNSNSDWEDSEPADAIIVHWPSQNVIPEAGWAFVNSDD